MKEMKITKFLALVFTVLFAVNCYGQQINSISGKCPSPNQLVNGRIKVLAVGDILHTPCPTKSSIFTGIVDFSLASSVIFPSGGAGVSGTGTTNFIPRWTNGASSILGNTPFSWNGTIYTWNNTALDATFLMNLTPSNGAGSFSVGSNAMKETITASTTIYTLENTPTTVSFIMNGTANTATLMGTSGVNIDGRTNPVSLGDVTAAASGTALVIRNSGGGNHQFVFTDTANIGIMNLTGVVNYQLQRTLTAAGTTGAQTINKPNGTVNFAAAATTLVVTNSVAIATSTINAVAQVNDATCSVKSVTRAVGSFIITMTAACTAETAVAFWVWN